MHSIRIAFCAMLLSFGSGAFAQLCADFVDVPASSPFCENVEWLKNRQITLGCASPPNPPNSYCPNDPVNRLQMAAFMNRLVTELAPAVVRVENSGGATSLAAPAVLCQTPPQAIADFPRTFVVWAVITALGAPNEELSLQIVRSTNGGAFVATNLLSTALSLRNIVSNNATLLSSPLPQPGAELDFGSSYVFGLRVARTGAGTANLSSFHCNLMLEVRNRQGTAPRF